MRDDIDPEEANKLAAGIRVAWLLPVNLERNDGLGTFLEGNRIIACSRFPVYAGVHAQ